MCLNPVRSSQELIIDKRVPISDPRRVVKFGTPKINNEGDLLLPCGKCTECISKRAVDWATRCRHEISCHKENCFITLTYDADNVPKYGDIKTEWQKFAKRLRKAIKKPIRYIVSHEYGTLNNRPHHHAIIFGWEPNNQKLNRKTKKGESLFTSPELEKLWSLGFSSIGTANEKTAYYIASYALKGKKHEFTCPKTGEIFQVSDSMDTSKRPAIGLEYFLQNMKQLSNEKFLPRYYIKKLQELNPTLHQHFENQRIFDFKNRSSHELLAKHVISNQQNSIHSEFRELDEYTKIYNDFLKQNLTYNRDNYVSKITEE